MAFHNLQLHMAYQYTKICLLNRYTFCESLVKICTTKHKCRSFLWYFFMHIWQCFRPAQIKSLKNQKSCHNMIILNEIRGIFSKYFKLLHIVVEVVDTLQTTDKKTVFQNYRWTSNFLFFVWLMFIFIFGFRTFFSETRENIGNIGWMKSQQNFLSLTTGVLRPTL